MAKENETIADIIAEMRSDANADEYTPDGILGQKLNYIADRLEAAHKREVDALKQRCAELVAEVAAKDEVIKRLNDAISEGQRRKMATAEKSSAVGDCAKLREALKHIKDRLPHMLQYMRVHREDASAGGYFDKLTLVIDAALAAPPRNCDVIPAEEMRKIFREELPVQLKIATEHEKKIIQLTADGIFDTVFALYQPPKESEAGK